MDPVRRWNVILFFSLAVSSPARGDVTELRDRLLASDPSTVTTALEEAGALGGSQRRLLVMSLIAPLRRDPESARAAARALARCGEASPARWRIPISLSGSAPPRF